MFIVTHWDNDCSVMGKLNQFMQFCLFGSSSQSREIFLNDRTSINHFKSIKIYFIIYLKVYRCLVCWKNNYSII